MILGSIRKIHTNVQPPGCCSWPARTETAVDNFAQQIQAKCDKPEASSNLLGVSFPVEFD